MLLVKTPISEDAAEDTTYVEPESQDHLTDGVRLSGFVADVEFYEFGAGAAIGVEDHLIGADGPRIASFMRFDSYR